MYNDLTLSKLKKALYNEFLPKPFKNHVIRAWDSLHMEENETIDEYNQKFWDYYS